MNTQYFIHYYFIIIMFMDTDGKNKCVYHNARKVVNVFKQLSWLDSL